MQKRLITFAEAMPIIFHGRRRHRRVAELGMLLHARRHTMRNVAARSFKSVVEPLTRNFIEVNRRGGAA